VIPKDGNTYVGAPGAVLDGRRLNRYAFTQHALNVTIRYLTVENFVTPLDEGVVNHDSGTGWTIEYNTVQSNTGAAVFLGTNNVLRSNCLTANGQYGFQGFAAGGASNLTVDGNEVSFNNTGDWEAVRPGCGCTGGAKFWDVRGAVVTNNWVHDNKSVGLWADTNEMDFRFEGNYINDNDAEGIFYEISYNAVIRGNTLKRNALVKGRTFAARNDPFPVGAIYLSESGGDARVTGNYATLEITGNLLEDNWSGVVLWENADRFCNSPSNTSSSYCTKGGAATLDTCVSGTINTAPYLADCRWKTKNVWVHNNDLRLDKAAIACTVSTRSCGLQGLFSNWGSWPTWSPYQGRTVQDAVTFSQNNVFSDNRYVGDWKFTAYEAGRNLDLAAWQAAPYNQDAGSTLSPVGSPPPSTTTTTASAPTSTTAATTTTTAPPHPNYIAGDTADFEGGPGAWVPWYAADASRSTLQAQSGAASGRISIRAPYGWGMQLNNWPGFVAQPGARSIGLWARRGGGTLGVTMSVTWRDGAGADLQVDRVSIPVLSTTWRQARASVTAPAGTAKVSVVLSSSTGAAGDCFYVDNLSVG